ncbi:hypothetical protein OBBRIDRAFT_806357 [Obba rivulosa]|uniref:Uncharacterized protein n=1 Tax=Obba rivulosa TaxID=1052685 RepID=A0A8E2DLL9_9APHY|nr:hypothetical protein OBBRIDRAFT_806357 [Obba rivulosa]
MPKYNVTTRTSAGLAPPRRLRQRQTTSTEHTPVPKKRSHSPDDLLLTPPPPRCRLRAVPIRECGPDGRWHMDNALDSLELEAIRVESDSAYAMVYVERITGGIIDGILCKDLYTLHFIAAAHDPTEWNSLFMFGPKVQLAQYRKHPGDSTGPLWTHRTDIRKTTPYLGCLGQDTQDPQVTKMAILVKPSMVFHSQHYVHEAVMNVLVGYARRVRDSTRIDKDSRASTQMQDEGSRYRDKDSRYRDEDVGTRTRTAGTGTLSTRISTSCTQQAKHNGVNMAARSASMVRARGIRLGAHPAKPIAPDVDTVNKAAEEAEVAIDKNGAAAAENATDKADEDAGATAG